MALVSGHERDLVAFHLSRQLRLGVAGHHPLAQRLGHALGIRRMQP